MNLVAVQAALAVMTVEAPLVAQRCAGVARQLVDEPEARVMTRRGVLGARIAQANDQLDHVESSRARKPASCSAKKPRRGLHAGGSRRPFEERIERILQRAHAAADANTQAAGVSPSAASPA